MHEKSWEDKKRTQKRLVSQSESTGRKREALLFVLILENESQVSEE